MAKLRPALTPFWYEPEGQGDDPAEFRLKQLTEPDMVEIESHYASGRPTQKSYFVAGGLAITQVRNLEDAEGHKAIWPQCRDLVPRELVVLCGMRAVVEATGGDWDKVYQEADGEEADPAEDPEKN